MNTGSDLYTFTKTIVNARKSHSIWSQSMVERYSDDSFYAFSRGKFLVALTNTNTNLERDLKS